MNREYISHLQDIGLTDKEARAYLSLLELGRGSSASVAELSGLKKPTAYVVLKNLIEKGFVRRIPKSKKQLFVAEPPSVALSASEVKLANFKSIIPNLDSLTKTSGKNKTRTLFFEGLSGMKKAYWYRNNDLKNAKYVSFYASVENISPELEAMLYAWSEESVALKMSSRAIAPNNPNLNNWRNKDTEYNRQVKIFPLDMYSAKNAIDIFPEFVRISVFGDLQCTIIEGREFAEAFKQIFELAWLNPAISE